MEKILQALISFGLTEKEAKVYLALYKIGEGTSYEVAKESGIKRPTVYVIMEELRKRGLALVVPHKKKQLYIAKDPNEFIGEYQSKFNQSANDILSLLPKLSRPDTDIFVFKGEGALVQGLSYGIHNMKVKKVIAFYAGVGKNTKVGGEYMEHFGHFYDLKIKLRAITPSDSNDKEFREDDRKYGFQTKKLSAKVFSPSVSTEVFDDFVKLIFHKKKEVVVINDSGLADFYRQTFEMMWALN